MDFDKEEIGGFAIIVVVLILGYLVWNSKIFQTFRLSYATQPELLVPDFNRVFSPRTTEEISGELGAEIPSSARLIASMVMPIQFSREREYQAYTDIFIIPEAEALEFIRSLPLGDRNEVGDQIEFELEIGHEVDRYFRWLVSDGIPVKTLSQNADGAKQSSVSISITNKVTADEKEIRFESKRIDYSNPVPTDPKIEKLKQDLFQKSMD